MNALNVAVETWAALLRPRRALALAAVAVPVLYGQSVWSADPRRGLAAGLLIVVGTVVVGPVAWRLFDPSRGLLGLAAFLAVSAVTVASCVVLVPRALGFEDTFLANTPTLFIVYGLFLAGGSGLGFDIEAERRAVLVERARDQAELLALRAQLDPHFLFNTLNAIAEWCVRDPAVAEQAIVRLSGVLRTVQGAVRTARWPLADELALCSDVLALHHVRDPQRFVGNVDGSVSGVLVPPMILLPLIENAIKHGPAAGHVGAVVVAVGAAGDGARVEVSNPGTFNGPREGGQGLELLRRRLALAYGEAARFEIGTAGAGTVASLVVPRAPTGDA